MLAAEGNIETNMSECQVFFAFFYLNGTSKKSIVHFNLVLPLAVVRVHTTFFHIALLGRGLTTDLTQRRHRRARHFKRESESGRGQSRRDRPNLPSQRRRLSPTPVATSPSFIKTASVGRGIEQYGTVS